jgi:hypothetical protein
MALPKKVIKNLSLYPEKVGRERRQELLDDINRDGTYLPKSILHEDLDRGFLDFVKNELKVVTDGKTIPVVDILISLQNWAQFSQTWNFKNLDKNTEPPFITTIRKPEVKFGSLPSLQYNIPNRRQYYYAAVPNWSGERKGVDIYTIPQPIPVDIEYSVKIICNRMRELNQFNKIVLDKFASLQAYTRVKGHYIRITWKEISDESVLDLEKRKYYIQSYDFVLSGFLLDENEFEVKPGITRALQIFETSSSGRTKKKKRAIENSDVISTEIVMSAGTTTYSKTFEYNVNLKLMGTENITSFNVYINNLFFGTTFSGLTNSVQLNSNDVLRIDIVQTDNMIDSVFKIEEILV